MTFADMPEVVHKAASAKGGRMRVKKGFAVNKELAKQAGSKGGRAKYENQSRKGTKQTQEGDSRHSTLRVADVLGDIDDPRN